MATISDTLGRLSTAWQRLGQRWTETGLAWHDIVRWHFQTIYWEPLERQTQATQRELERLIQVVAQAERHVK